MTEERPFPVRRLLVALDASGHSLAALEAAARLAAHLEVELAGIFVEDENLLRLAKLGTARVVDRLSARVRTLGAGEIERELRGRRPEAPGPRSRADWFVAASATRARNELPDSSSMHFRRGRSSSPHPGRDEQ